MINCSKCGIFISHDGSNLEEELCDKCKPETEEVEIIVTVAE